MAADPIETAIERVAERLAATWKTGQTWPSIPEWCRYHAELAVTALGESPDDLRRLADHIEKLGG